MYLAQRRDSVIASYDYLMQSLCFTGEKTAAKRLVWFYHELVTEPQLEFKGCPFSTFFNIHFVLWTLKLLILGLLDGSVG